MVRFVQSGVKARKNSGKPLTTRTFLLDSPIFSARSAECTLHVRREMMGFSVRFPEGASTVKFRVNHPPVPLPVVGINPNQPG